MVKASAEGSLFYLNNFIRSSLSRAERIMHIGKKKLALDHVIVQKMEDTDDSEDLQTVLTFGAQALLEENEEERNRDVTCAWLVDPSTPVITFVQIRILKFRNSLRRRSKKGRVRIRIAVRLVP